MKFLVQTSLLCQYIIAMLYNIICSKAFYDFYCVM